jgi:hypothetical protein
LALRGFFFELTVIHSPSSLFCADFCDPFDGRSLVVVLVGATAFLSEPFAVVAWVFLSSELLLGLLFVALLGDFFELELGVDFLLGELLLTRLLVGDDLVDELLLLLDLDEVLFEDCHVRDRNK